MTTYDQSTEHLRIILDSISEGVFTVDKNWRITSFNRAAEKITGSARSEAIGQRCCEVFRASICETECVLKATMETGKPVPDRNIYIINSEGKRIPISISTGLLKDRKGNIIGGVETFRDLSLVEELRKELGYSYTFEDIISKSPAIREIFSILPSIAQSDSTVLILGESGTGKELLARAVHNLSRRKNHALVSINCSALPDNLLESELFGYKAGAFTDAKRDKPGRFALADSGTIFLDEIGDITPAMQVKLLRVLQEKEIEPLGAIKPQKVDVRVIAATNRNLTQLIEDGKFRVDFYYRINVITLEMPPLRSRREDIPLLTDHFVARFNRLQNKSIAGVSPAALNRLMHHDFPGNVRELENILEHAFVLCNGNLIERQHLPSEFQEESAGKAEKSPKTFRDVETEFILDALRRNKWNRLQTARELGMHKTTLFRKIKNLGIKLPEIDGRYAVE